MKTRKEERKFNLWLLLPLLIFIFAYPMFISIYVFIPLMIGIMGYYLIEGIQTHKLHYILFSVIYFVNLEVNLSLPLFLTIISTLLVYLLFSQPLSSFRQCHRCRAVLTVIVVDMVYLLVLLGYDIVFATSSIILDSILLYSLVVDILLVFVL